MFLLLVVAVLSNMLGVSFQISFIDLFRVFVVPKLVEAGNSVHSAYLKPLYDRYLCTLLFGEVEHCTNESEEEEEEDKE